MNAEKLTELRQYHLEGVLAERHRFVLRLIQTQIRVDIAARKLRKGIPVIGEIDAGAMSVGTQGEEVVRSKANDVDVVFWARLRR